MMNALKKKGQVISFVAAFAFNALIGMQDVSDF